MLQNLAWCLIPVTLATVCTTCFNIKGYAFGALIVLCFLLDKTVSLNDAVSW